MVCKHGAEKSDSGVPLLQDLGCLHLLRKEVGGADPQDEGVFCLGVLLFCGPLDMTFLGGFTIKEENFIINEVADHG